MTPAICFLPAATPKAKHVAESKAAHYSLSLVYRKILLLKVFVVGVGKGSRMIASRQSVRVLPGLVRGFHASDAVRSAGLGSPAEPATGSPSQVQAAVESLRKRLAQGVRLGYLSAWSGVTLGMHDGRAGDGF